MPFSATPYPQLDDVLRRYQNPHEADSLMKVQRELDETKIVLVCHYFCLCFRP